MSGHVCCRASEAFTDTQKSAQEYSRGAQEAAEKAYAMGKQAMNYGFEVMAKDHPLNTGQWAPSPSIRRPARESGCALKTCFLPPAFTNMPQRIEKKMQT
jgi:hypothetical protein